MAENKSILQYNYNGTGTEIPPINVDKAYQQIWLQDSAIAAANYALTFSGTPVAGTTVVIKNFGTLDLGLIPYTFTIFGFPVTQTQLFNNCTFTLSHDGTNWFFNVVTTQTSGFPTITSNDIVSLNGAKIESGTLDLGAAGIALSLDTTKIADQAVTTLKIAALAVTNAEIDNATIDASQKVVAGSVTNTELADMADGTIKGNDSGMGAQPPSDISISTLFDSYGWRLDGNTGTSPGTDFIGTTDNQDLVFKVANTESGRIGWASGNVSFGVSTLASNTTGNQNVALGNQALTSNTTGLSNIGIGDNSLAANIGGIDNVGVGIRTLENTLANRNVAVGTYALQDNDLGNNNVAIGYNAGANIIGGGADNNVAVGYLAGATLNGGNSNTLIGAGADVTNPATTNSIALGFNAVTTLDNQFALPNTVTDWKIRGNNFTLPSADGAANAVLQTDGAGVLSFGSIVDSGTYTPTLSNNTNIASSAAFVCQWMRVGSVVTVSGKVDIEATANPAASELGMTLPIASNFASEEQCGGTSVSDTTATVIRIIADSVNNRASFVFNAASSGSSDSYSFNFTYLII